MPRRTTTAARLARLGFADPARAELLLTGDLAIDAREAGDGLIDALALAADPDLALAALARMPRDAELTRALDDDPRLRARLAAVLGVSAALGDHLARHPEHWRALAGHDDLPAPDLIEGEIPGRREEKSLHRGQRRGQLCPQHAAVRFLDDVVDIQPREPRSQPGPQLCIMGQHLLGEPAVGVFG